MADNAAGDRFAVHDNFSLDHRTIEVGMTGDDVPPEIPALGLSGFRRALAHNAVAVDRLRRLREPPGTCELEPAAIEQHVLTLRQIRNRPGAGVDLARRR